MSWKAFILLLLLLLLCLQGRIAGRAPAVLPMPRALSVLRLPVGEGFALALRPPYPSATHVNHGVTSSHFASPLFTFLLLCFGSDAFACLQA